MRLACRPDKESSVMTAYSAGDLLRVLQLELAQTEHERNQWARRAWEFEGQPESGAASLGSRMLTWPARVARRTVGGKTE
jgi:hypothetical protein